MKLKKKVIFYTFSQTQQFLDFEGLQRVPNWKLKAPMDKNMYYYVLKTQPESFNLFAETLIFAF